MKPRRCAASRRPRSDAHLAGRIPEAGQIPAAQDISPKKPLADLAASVKEKGVLSPILVRPLGADRYEIVAGERRWRAAQMAKLHDVPVVVRELADAEALEIAIIENVQRADLNAIEEAAAYQELIDRFGRTQEQVAQEVGKSRPHVANTIRLLQLPDSGEGLVREGKLTAGHARTLLGARRSGSRGAGNCWPAR